MVRLEVVVCFEVAQITQGNQFVFTLYLGWLSRGVVEKGLYQLGLQTLVRQVAVKPLHCEKKGHGLVVVHLLAVHFFLNLAFVNAPVQKFKIGVGVLNVQLVVLIEVMKFFGLRL